MRTNAGNDLGTSFSVQRIAAGGTRLPFQTLDARRHRSSVSFDMAHHNFAEDKDRLPPIVQRGSSDVRCANISRNAQAKISGLPALLLILILAIICGFSDLAHGQNTPLQIRLEKALENARSITNVEIQYDDVIWKKGRPDSTSFTNDFALTSHITYIASEGKYRTECQNESPFTNIIKFSEVAFDGKLYSEIDSRAHMVQQDGDTWVTTGSDLHFQQLRPDALMLDVIEP